MDNLTDSAKAFVLPIIFMGILLGGGAIALMGLSSSTLTTASEVFNGTAGTPATLSGSVITVNRFDLATIATTYNGTKIGANGSVLIPLDSDFVSTPNYTTLRYNLTITAQVQGSDLVTLTDNCNGNLVLVNGVNNATNRSAPCLASPYSANFTFNNTANSSNITNVSISYLYWETSTAYSTSSGILTPSVGGVFRIGYDYTTAANYFSAASTNNALLGVVNLSLQMPPLGTIVGISLIVLVLVVGVGLYLTSKR